MLTLCYLAATYACTPVAGVILDLPRQVAIAGSLSVPYLRANYDLATRTLILDGPTVFRSGYE